MWKRAFAAHRDAGNGNQWLWGFSSAILNKIREGLCEEGGASQWGGRAGPEGQSGRCDWRGRSQSRAKSRAWLQTDRGLQEWHHSLSIFHGVKGSNWRPSCARHPWLTFLGHLGVSIASVCCTGALLEKKVDVDKRGLGVTDYNGVVTKALGCRPPVSKDSSGDRPTFLDKVWTRVVCWLVGF